MEKVKLLFFEKPRNIRKFFQKIVFSYPVGKTAGKVLLTAAVLPTLFGIWLLYRGFIGIVQGMDLRSFHVPNAGWVVFASVVMIAISFGVLLLPDSLGVGTIVISVAIAFLVYGFSSIALGFRLYDVHRRARDLE